MDLNLNVNHNLYIHLVPDTAITSALAELKAAIAQLTQTVQIQGAQMSAELDALSAQVTQNTDVEGSAVVLLQGLSTQIAALKSDPVKLQALSDSLKTSASSLADAITANTPAA